MMWHQRLKLKRFGIFYLLGSLLLLAFGNVGTPAAFARQNDAVGGELRFRADTSDPNAPVYFCPLQRTDIGADLSGMFGRIRVRQVFTNPTNRKIEALYVFPLPENAAIDQMVMTVGRHRVIGVVKEKAEARAVYEVAKAQGKVASLLDQERPNVFTQSVANIGPGATVVIEISMVQTLSFDNGVFTWSFPTVVGPRYVPGAPIGKTRQTARLADTDRVPDASRLSPPVVPPMTRTGHTLGLTVHLNTGGLPLTEIQSMEHQIQADTTQAASGQATVTLVQKQEIPNRDFVLHFRVGGQAIGDALFTTQGPPSVNDPKSRDPYFSLLVTPPRRPHAGEIVPKEMVFVIDRSGSMGGFPIEKAKEAMRGAISAMNPGDTFNLLSFSGGTGKAFSHPVANTPQNRAEAFQYLSDLTGAGGTEMLPAINEALSGTPSDGRIRVVCFMTDGFIGNEGEIIRAIQQNRKTARVFAFGIGTSVNRFLLDAMARAGRGAVEYVTLQEDADAAVSRFRKRIQSPVLTDVSLDFNGLPVYDVYPKQIPDLFDAAPVIVYGRIRGNLPPKGAFILRGHTPSGAFARTVRVSSGGQDMGIGNDAVVSLWARQKADDLMASDPMALQGGQTQNEAIKKAVTQLGCEYNLMTPFTSFVAVDDQSYTGSDAPDEVSVPVNTPSGVSYEGAVGGSSTPVPVFATKRLYGVSGSMAAQGKTLVPFSGPTAAPTFAAQPGDPLIRITDAPADTRLIVAVLPDGTTVPLLKAQTPNTYEAHFDIPLSAPEGAYTVRVILIRANGERRTLLLRYFVDTTGAIALGSVHAEQNQTAYRLEMETGEGVARVVVLLPDGSRREMTATGEAGTHFVAHVPASAMENNGAPPFVTFIVTDRAHNRTVVTVDGAR